MKKNKKKFFYILAIQILAFLAFSFNSNFNFFKSKTISSVNFHLTVNDEAIAQSELAKVSKILFYNLDLKKETKIRMHKNKCNIESSKYDIDFLDIIENFDGIKKVYFKIETSEISEEKIFSCTNSLKMIYLNYFTNQIKSKINNIKLLITNYEDLKKNNSNNEITNTLLNLIEINIITKNFHEIMNLSRYESQLLNILSSFDVSITNKKISNTNPIIWYFFSVIILNFFIYLVLSKKRINFFKNI